MNIINKILTTMLLFVSSFSFANVNNLTPESSWDEIRRTANVEIDGDTIRVGDILTTVFDVELKDGKLYTKQPTQNGYYDLRYGVGSNQGVKYVETDKTIKSGDVVIKKPIYEYAAKVGSNQGVESKLIGYKSYEQPLTRTLKVYKSREIGQQNNYTRTFLFEKEYQVK